MWVLCLLGLACGRAPPPADLAGRWPDAQTCPVPRGVPGPEAAVRCAEAFIARNGYTPAPPADSAQLAFETIEWAVSLREILAQRRGTLEPRGAALCEGGARGPGYTVAFRYQESADTTRGRAVTMTPSHGRLRVEHQEFMPVAARRGEFGCRALP